MTVEDRLSDELAALATAGVTVTSVDGDAGGPTWTCVLEHDYDAVTVEVRIGEGFPWLPPTVTSNEPFLQRHQVPSRDGSFCLDRSDAPWWTPEHRVVDLLQHLQRLLHADTTGAARAEEADMTEPASAFLSGRGCPIVLLTRTMLTPDLGLREGALELIRISGAPVRWLVTAIRANGDAKLDLREESRPSSFELMRNRIIQVPWTDLGEVRDRNGVDAARRAVMAMAPAATRRRRDRRAPHSWRAVTFMEEGPTRERTRRAWAFAQVSGSDPEWAATQALTVGERDARRAQLVGLGAARVTVFGLGALGAAIALQAAQAGVVDLHFVDYDEYDINNGVRHILPADALGQRKATATARFINAHQPFCRAVAHELNVGHTPGSLNAATSLIAESDLVIDATGALMVSRFLGATAAINGVPAIHCALIAGGGYGYVFVRRKRTGCIDHFLKHPDIAIPSVAELPNSTPYGCSHPAASCAPFEPAQLAIHAARTAAGILTTREYPEFTDDWLTVGLGHKAVMTSGLLTRVADCHYCSL